MHAFIFLSIHPEKGGMLPGISSGDHRNWGWESWQVSYLYANESCDEHAVYFGRWLLWHIKVEHVFAVWRWCNFPRIEALDFLVIMGVYYKVNTPSRMRKYHCGVLRRYISQNIVAKTGILPSNRFTYVLYVFNW